jgi:multidrug efflux system membrane fusion protein
VLSAALLTLDDAGVVGVKAVDASKRVRFYPVEVVASEADGLSVTGLPQELDLITVGQGYVRPGDLVEPSSADQAGLSDASSVTAGSQSRR